MSPIPSPARFAPQLSSVLRMVAAILFMQHGAQKLLGFPVEGAPMNFPFLSLMWIAGVLELVGGLLLLVGLLTRPVAFVLSGEMAFAYFMQHAPQGPWPVLNGGELAILYCFLWLYLVAAGPGPWSLDTVLRKR